MTMKNSMLLTAAVLLFACFAGSSRAATIVPDWNMPGIPDAGFPHFEDAVKVNFAKSGSNWKLTATQRAGTHLFQSDPGTAHNVANSSFSLTAMFDSSLNFTGGNLQIKGKIPSLGVNTSTSLWKTSLTDFGFDINPFDGSPVALGFETSGHSGWAAQFSGGAPESVYLLSPDLSSLAVNLFSHKGVSASINATALTTVPVPAAAWLLGSGLIALFGMRRGGAAAALPA